MNNLLKLKALVITMVTAFFVSCSSDEQFESIENDAAKTFVYDMQLNAPVPGYDGETSRATSWANGSVVYLDFTTGSSHVYGKATYSSSTSSWKVEANSTIPATSTATQVKAYYIENPVSTSGNTVNMSYSSIPYVGTGTYTSSSSSVYVNVTMSPYCGRLRFKGTSNTAVSLKSADNMISYVSSFNASNCTYSYDKKDISLSVKSTGYTDYIYGYFHSGSGNNRTITVTTDATYQRTDILSSVLDDGKSACLTVPTNSNYQSLGWTKVGGGTDNVDKNAYVKVNLLVPFTDGYCTDWTVGTTAKTFYYTTYKNLPSTTTDEDLISSLTNGSLTARDAQEYADILSMSTSETFYSSASDTYTIVSVAYNSSGQRGPVCKYDLKINSTALSIATLSNLKSTSDSDGNCWTFDVSLKNNATKYYIWSSTEDYMVSRDEHFNAWNVYYAIKNNQITKTYNWESVRMERSTQKVVIMTYAANSKNEIGNYSIIKYPSTSTAKAVKTTKSSVDNSSNTHLCDETVSTHKTIPFRMKQYDIHPFMNK